MTNAELNAYSAEVLAFQWKDRAAGARTPDAPLPEAGTPGSEPARILRLAEKGRRRDVILFGLGSGALAAALARDLPAGTRLTVLCLDPNLARALRRAGRLSWWTPEGPHVLLADTSAWALLLLLDRAGLAAGDCLLARNPEVPDDAAGPLEALRRTWSACRALAVPAVAPERAPRLTAAAILSPEEPDLPAFLARFPAWLAEVLLVWDAESVPDHGLSCAAPLRQTARPLAGDFAAQRNLLLAEASGDWVVSLDADEVLEPGDWLRLPGLTSQGGIAGWHLPRLTYYPDREHCRMGFGLWPDLQLRLFRRSPGLRFTHPVHERLTGLDGPEAIAADLALRHLTHVLKRPEDIRRKLAVFDQASGERVRHTLSRDYPHLLCGLLAPAPARDGAVHGLVPPSATAPSS